MDPITIWILCLATAWFIRRGVEDAWAAAQGRESPRLARRRTQHELAQRHRADTGAPTIGQAVTGRIAQRIAEPREPGAFRRYLGELWEDSWVDATDAHRARRARKQRRAEAGPDADEVVLESRPCPGGCEPPRWLAGDLDVCSECVEARYEWPDDPDYPDDDIVDAEIVDSYGVPCEDCDEGRVDHPGQLCAPCAWDDTPHPEPVLMDKADPTDQHDPEPNPAPATERKDNPVMAEPTTINGDTVSPLENLAFADGCLELNAAIRNELDTIANNLAAANVGAGVVQTVRDAWNAAEAFAVSATGARQVYARHVATQADIAGDEELRNTVAGTYLDNARA